MLGIGNLGVGIGRLGRPSTHLKGVSFNLDAFMAAQSDGLYFDTTKTDRLFSTSPATGFANTTGQAIGVAIDQRTFAGKSLDEYLAGRPELLANPNFDTVASWFATGGSSVAGGKGRIVTPDTTYSALYQNVATVGKLYRNRVSVEAITAGALKSDFASSWNFIAGTGTREIYGVATQTDANYARSSGATDITIDNASFKEIVGKHGIQATGSLKPILQATGAKFDGLDDNWLTNYTAGAGENFIVALVDVPASMTGTQAIAGADATASTDFFYLGFSSTGLVRRGVGASNQTLGSNDLRGQVAVIGLSYNGSIVNTFENEELIDTSAQSGGPSTVIPLRIGARNGNGTAGNFFGGSVKKLVAGRQFLDLATYLKIRAALLAA